MQPLRPPSRRLLAELLAVPGLDSGRPWRPDEVAPLPDLPPSRRACYRSGRQGMLSALERRGMVARTADGRYFLTVTAVRIAEAVP